MESTTGVDWFLLRGTTWLGGNRRQDGLRSLETRIAMISCVNMEAGRISGCILPEVCNTEAGGVPER